MCARYYYWTTGDLSTINKPLQTRVFPINFTVNFPAPQKTALTEEKNVSTTHRECDSLSLFSLLHDLRVSLSLPLVFSILLLVLVHKHMSVFRTCILPRFQIVLSWCINIPLGHSDADSFPHCDTSFLCRVGIYAPTRSLRITHQLVVALLGTGWISQAWHIW